MDGGASADGRAEGWRFESLTTHSSLESGRQLVGRIHKVAQGVTGRGVRVRVRVRVGVRVRVHPRLTCTLTHSKRAYAARHVHHVGVEGLLVLPRVLC